MQIDESTVSAIQEFVKQPNVDDQEKTRHFLDACCALLESAREDQFGSSGEAGSDVIMDYYRKTLMPELDKKLSLNRVQTETAAQHIASLSSAISNQVTLGRLSMDQIERLNGLVTLLEVFVSQVFQKIDNRRSYYQFEDAYISVVRSYVGASASEPKRSSFPDSIVSFFSAKGSWPYSPRGDAHEDAAETVKLTRESKKNDDKDFDTDVSKKGLGSGSYSGI
jgi:hypothetical protein